MEMLKTAYCTVQWKRGFTDFTIPRSDNTGE